MVESQFTLPEQMQFEIFQFQTFYLTPSFVFVANESLQPSNNIPMAFVFLTFEDPSKMTFNFALKIDEKP